MASAIELNNVISLHPRSLLILSVTFPAIVRVARLSTLCTVTDLALVQYIVYLVGRAVYNVYFHPLSAFPGPKSFAATRVSHVRALLGGQLCQTVKDLHDEYGEIVRIAPDELSFDTPQAWRDIYGHRQGHKSMQKDPALFGLPPEGVHNIITTPIDSEHSRMRRLLAHAFSEKALREQEPLVMSYVDMFIDKLHEQIAGPEGRQVDLVRWYSFTTFDIIADLAFGESFHCLENAEYHSWVTIIFQTMKFLAYLQAARRFPPLTKALKLILPRRLRKQGAQRMQYNKALVDKRLKLGKNVDRPDFISYILRHNDEKGMSRMEIQSCAAVLTTAGSDSPAALLSGVTFHLLNNPDTYQKLVAEVRTTFKHEKEIRSSAVAQLPYLAAVLEEGFRIYPPVPCTIPRVTAPEGDEVCGRWIPGNVSPPFFLSLSASFHPSHFLPPLTITYPPRRPSSASTNTQPTTPPKTSPTRTPSSPNAGCPPPPPPSPPPTQTSTFPPTRNKCSNLSVTARGTAWGRIWHTWRCGPFWRACCGPLISNCAPRVARGRGSACGISGRRSR